MAHVFSIRGQVKERKDVMRPVVCHENIQLEAPSQMVLSFCSRDIQLALFCLVTCLGFYNILQKLTCFEAVPIAGQSRCAVGAHRVSTGESLASQGAGSWHRRRLGWAPRINMVEAC